MIPFIKDLENYKDTLIKNCVFKLLVWDDTKDMYIPYVGEKTFQKETKVEKLFKYRSSNKGITKQIQEFRSDEGIIKTIIL